MDNKKTIIDVSSGMTVIVMDSNGVKYNLDLNTFKEIIVKQVLDLQPTYEEPLQITTETILKALSKETSIPFNKPINILSSIGIEKTWKDGDIYFNGKELRINNKGVGTSIKLNNG